MHRIRLVVYENKLSDHSEISEDSYVRFLEARSGWVAEANATVVGFAVADLATQNVWALFVDPEFEGRGVGKALHEHLIRWAGDKGLDCLSLSTGLGTRAERFYRKHGWVEVSRTSDGEVFFRLRLTHSNSTMT